jgi:dihydrodiol dehydrogenase / D-xylose 1-dehydrogenase (NADP)
MLQFQQFVFRGLRPIKIAVNGHLNNQNTDESAAAIITYPEGKMAVVSTSARVSLPNEGIVVGTKGTIRMPDFWCPTQLITPISHGAELQEKLKVRICLITSQLNLPN